MHLVIDNVDTKCITEILKLFQGRGMSIYLTKVFKDLCVLHTKAMRVNPVKDYFLPIRKGISHSKCRGIERNGIVGAIEPPVLIHCAALSRNSGESLNPPIDVLHIEQM